MPTDTAAFRRTPLAHAAFTARDGDVIRSTLEPIGPRETIGAMLDRNAERFGGHAAYQERRDGAYRPVSWTELRDDACAFAHFLASRGVGPGDRVAVVSPNRGDMLAAELGTMCRGAIHVPLFAGYSAEQTASLLLHARPKVLLLPDVTWLSRIAAPPSARAVLSFEATARDCATVPGFRDTLRRFATTAADRRDLLTEAAAGDPDAPCLMMYTSGTSGVLKGVLLTHDNILSQRRALRALWQVTPNDRFLSYLPWHHSFGGIFEKFTALYEGATIFVDDSLGKDFESLRRNWLEARPTIYFSVPKVYQQLVAHAEAHPEEEPRIFHPELRFVFTAAAPLPANLSRFFAARGIPVVEGWGLTETSPCCALTDPAEPRTVAGVVGYPIPGVTIRVQADGEILVRGPNVMPGYYQDREASEQALPGDGWFHTGDLGELSGTALRLVARKDRVFKLSNAEKVVPTEIENRLAGMNRFIRHVIVTGAGKSFLSALVFPDYFRIASEFGDDRDAADRAVKASLLETIAEFNRTHAVKYERIQAVAVVSKELSIEDDELTPSLKVRVRNVLSHSASYLEAVYEPGPSCDCRVLRRVLRPAGDERRCFGGLDRTIDRCHECGGFIFDIPTADAAPSART